MKRVNGEKLWLRASFRAPFFRFFLFLPLFSRRMQARDITKERERIPLAGNIVRDVSSRQVLILSPTFAVTASTSDEFISNESPTRASLLPRATCLFTTCVARTAASLRIVVTRNRLASRNRYAKDNIFIREEIAPAVELLIKLRHDISKLIIRS